MQRSRRAQAFLDDVCAQVRWKQAHDVIRRDLSDHIEDQTEALIQDGLPRGEAVRCALKEMGDPVDVGLRLDASYRPQTEWRMLAPLLALIAAGVALQLFQYASLPHYESYPNENLIKLGIASGVGGVLAVLLYNVNLYRLSKLSCVLYAIACLLVRSNCDYLLRPANDAVMYCAVLLVPVFFAGVTYCFRGGGLLAAAAINALFAFPVFGIVLVGESFFCAFICLTGCVLVLAIAVLSGHFACNKWLTLLVGLLVWAAALGVLSINPFRLWRWRDCVLPGRFPLSFDAPESVGVREILQNAKWFGTGTLTSAGRWVMFGPTGSASGGFAQSSQWTMRTVLLPTYVVYRFGRAAGIALIAVLVSAIAAGVRRCIRLKSVLGRLYAAAILCVFTVEVALYLLPCLGVPRFERPFPLPFLSVGYYAQTMNLALMGGLLSLFRTDTLFTDAAARKRKRTNVKKNASA